MGCDDRGEKPAGVIAEELSRRNSNKARLLKYIENWLDNSPLDVGELRIVRFWAHAGYSYTINQVSKAETFHLKDVD